MEKTLQRTLLEPAHVFLAISAAISYASLATQPVKAVQDYPALSVSLVLSTLPSPYLEPVSVMRASLGAARQRNASCVIPPVCRVQVRSQLSVYPAQLILNWIPQVHVSVRWGTLALIVNACHATLHVSPAKARQLMIVPRVSSTLLYLREPLWELANATRAFTSELIARHVTSLAKLAPVQRLLTAPVATPPHLPPQASVSVDLISS